MQTNEYAIQERLLLVNTEKCSKQKKRYDVVLPFDHKTGEVVKVSSYPKELYILTSKNIKMSEQLRYKK